MDSDTTDRQIQDLDTGYQKSDFVRKEVSSRNQELPLDIARAFPQENKFAVTGLQVTLQTVGMIFIVIIASVAGLYAVHKLKQKQQATSISSSLPEPTEEPTIGEPTPLLNFTMELPLGWTINNSEANIWEITTLSQTIIQIQALSTGSYLTSDRTKTIAQVIQQTCQSNSTIRNCNLDLNSLETTPHSSLEVEQLELHFTKEEKQISQALWIVRVDNTQFDTLIIFSFDIVPIEEFDEILVGLKVN